MNHSEQEKMNLYVKFITDDSNVAAFSTFV